MEKNSEASSFSALPTGACTQATHIHELKTQFPHEIVDYTVGTVLQNPSNDIKHAVTVIGLRYELSRQF